MIASVLTEYYELITDPAHLLLEATLIVVVDGIIGALLFPFAKRWLRKHDSDVHGQDHLLERWAKESFEEMEINR